MTLIRWILSLAILAVWGALIGTGLYVALYTPDADVPEGKAIVILAGNAGKSGAGLSGETAERLAAGLSLYRQGAATVIVVTGGGTPPVAEDMAAALLGEGLPADAVLIENRSHSTLQNALFTADFDRLNPSDPIILVTHRYHLPRAKASFWWAGFSDVTTFAADPDAGFALTRGVMWESLKWPLNVLRAGAASIAAAFDVPRESYLKYLE
jgi:uncharacterized SAM-binding protein YcdF (DUF218 family)